jgi:hypothetical protein
MSVRLGLRRTWVWVVLAWSLVGVPLAWGIYQTLKTAVKIFR